MAAPAPGELELIRRFVNTYDPNDSTDVIAGPAALRDWLQEQGLGVSDVDDHAVTEAAALREALREVLLAHHAAAPPPVDAIRTINALAAGSTLTVQLDEDGEPLLTPVHEELSGAFGAFLAVVYRAAQDGTWRRLKVCPADDCLWAFYDQSKNRSRTWCSMDACGNRAKARAYRARHRP